MPPQWSYVGGPHGYTLFLGIVGDGKHEQHEDMVRWIGGVFGRRASI
jgi:hypothetical protein